MDRCCFDTVIYCNKIATIMLARTSITSHNCSFIIVRTIQISCLNNFEVYNAVLLTILYWSFLVLHLSMSCISWTIKKIRKLVWHQFLISHRILISIQAVSSSLFSSQQALRGKIFDMDIEDQWISYRQALVLVC